MTRVLGRSRRDRCIRPRRCLASESGAHRLGSLRSRPALLPGAPQHGRDPRRQLHGLPRSHRRRPLRPRHRRRGLGRRPLLAREPRTEARIPRLAHRLRRLPPDARRRRPRSVPHRRLQRRDDRTHRQLPEHPRSIDLRRQRRRRRPGDLRTGPAEDPRLDRGALRLLRLHHRLHTPHPRSNCAVACRARLPR